LSSIFFYRYLLFLVANFWFITTIIQRGNLQTRFKKLDASDSPYTGIILAVAGLKRIGLAERITSYLEPPDLYHAVGQGAIGIEIRTPPEIKLNETVEETILRERATTVRRLVKSLEDWRTALSCEAERALLRRLEGGCSVPVGVTSSLVDLPMPCPWAPKARLTLTGVVTSVDGLEEVRKEAWLDVCGPKDAAHLGTALADELFRDGADKILDQLNSVKKLDLEEEAASESTSGSSNPSRIATLESQSHFVIAAPANSSRTDIGSNQDYIVF
jgi:hydroxymethylbilane synthase